MKSDIEIVNDLKEIDVNTVEAACELLRQYSVQTCMYLANMVAALCNVDLDDMLTDSKHLQNSHARWFFWYAYRYMTKENYDSIARKTGTKRLFTVGNVGYCVSKMSMMVEQEPIWIKRWTVIKRVIKAILDTDDNCADAPIGTLTFKVQPPKGIDVKVQVIK